VEGKIGQRCGQHDKEQELEGLKNHTTDKNKFGEEVGQK
jgi:hypothetical protein